MADFFSNFIPLAKEQANSSGVNPSVAIIFDRMITENLVIRLSPYDEDQWRILLLGTLFAIRQKLEEPNF